MMRCWRCDSDNGGGDGAMVRVLLRVRLWCGAVRLWWCASGGAPWVVRAWVVRACGCAFAGAPLRVRLWLW